MRIAAIIAEYNPFHNGHLYHISRTRELTNCDYLIAVMSGNFIQRGYPAVCDKFSRARGALLHGVDLVIELPVYLSTACAEYFAFGAVSALHNTRVVNHLSFGSECGDVDALWRVAEALTDADISKRLDVEIKNAARDGLSYPASRSRALSGFADDDILKNPNNILGIEYLKALKKLNSDIKPMTIERTGEGYHSERINGYASATAIRKAVSTGNLDDVRTTMPEAAFEIFADELAKRRTDIDALSSVFQYIVRSTPKTQISEMLDVTEGLENRFLSAAAEAFRLTELIDRVKTKRYTHTRISRTLLHILLGIDKATVASIIDNGVPYLRVLGFRRNSVDLLSHLTSVASVPVITNIKKALDDEGLAATMLRKEIFATDMFNLCDMNHKTYPINHELTAPIVVVD